MNNFKEQKSILIRNLHTSTKSCQAEFFNKSEVVTESNIIVANLCKDWEGIFIHGLRKKLIRNIFSIKNSNLVDVPVQLIQQIKPLSLNNTTQTGSLLWMLLCELLDRQDLVTLFSHLETDISKFRAWLRTVINEHSLERVLIKLLSNSCQIILASKYYEPYALLLDQEENGVLPNLAAGISSIMFSLDTTELQFLNQPLIQSTAIIDGCRSQLNSSSSSSNSRVPLFSSSTNGSFEDIDIENDCNSNNLRHTISSNRARKNRIINISSIEDNVIDSDDGNNDTTDDADDTNDCKSDSSDLYSPFSLIKSGINFVTRFPFVNDMKLNDVKEEQSSQIDLNSTIINRKYVPQTKHQVSLESNTTRNEECDEDTYEHQFKDCRLSLKTDFYSSLSDTNTNNTTNSSLNGSRSNENSGDGGSKYTDVELMVSDNITKNDDAERNLSLSISQSTSTESFRTSGDSDKEKLKEKIDMLKNQLDTIKQEHTEQYDKLLVEHAKVTGQNQSLQKENDLLRNRLKYYLMREDDFEKQAKYQTELNGTFGPIEVVNGKVRQLTEMHAELLELNEQLHRNLVNKDVTIGMLQSKVALLLHDDETSGIHIDGLGTIHLSIDNYSICRSDTDSSEFINYQINIFCSPAATDYVEITNDANQERSQISKPHTCIQWTCQRRFSEFYSFYNSLPPAIRRIISFPSRWSIGGVSLLVKKQQLTSEQILERQKSLETFLRLAVSRLVLNQVTLDASAVSCPVLSKKFLSDLVPLLKENLD